MEESNNENRTKKKRPVYITMAMIFICVGLMYYYIEDISFFFARPEPVMMGDADKIDKNRLVHNSYISVSGIPDPRMLKGDSYVYFFFTKTYNYYVFMGNTTILVKEPVELNKSRKDEGLDIGPRTGRFLRFDKYSNQRELAQAREYFTKRLGRHFDQSGGVLISGERPYKDYVTLIVYLILVGVLIFNLIDICQRIVKRKDLN